mgnify:CR=1 FL=1
MSIIFKVMPYQTVYNITIIFKDSFRMYNCYDIIKDQLQVDVNDFNEVLNSYGGICGRFGELFKYKIIYFTSRKNAELFVSEYLEPQLTIRKLSI